MGKNIYKIQEDYIHFHQKHYNYKIGDKVAKAYFLQKSQALLRYSSGFEYQLLKSNEMDLLNEVVALNGNNANQVYEELNQILAENVQKAIDSSETNIGSMGDDFATIRQHYRQMFSNRRASLKELQDFLNDSALIFNNLNLDGGIISLLAAELQDKKYNAKDFAIYIKDFIAKNNKTLQKTSAFAVNQFLTILGQRLYDKSTGTGARGGGRVSYSAKKMSNLIIKLFNANVGEYKIAEILASMKDDGTEEIIQQLLTGEHRRISITRQGEKRTVDIKPDVIADGLKVVYKKNNAVFNFNVTGAASIKTYNSGANKFGFGIGTRYLLRDIESTINFNGNKKRYWIENALSQSEASRNYYYAGVIKQHIDLLLSGTQQLSNKGTTDFANLFIANGKVFSMYDLIKKIVINKNPMDVLDKIKVIILGGKVGKGQWIGAEPNWENAKERSRNMQLRYNELTYTAKILPTLF